jgi:hypothetical protein
MYSTRPLTFSTTVAVSQLLGALGYFEHRSQTFRFNLTAWEEPSFLGQKLPDLDPAARTPPRWPSIGLDLIK